MSGSSYDYLFTKDLREVDLDMLEAMAARLDELGYRDLASATRAAAVRVVAAMDWYESRRRNLQDVWKAVEWLDSGDWGPEQVEATVARWRAGAGPGETKSNITLCKHGTPITIRCELCDGSGWQPHHLAAPHSFTIPPPAEKTSERVGVFQYECRRCGGSFDGARGGMAHAESKFMALLAGADTEPMAGMIELHHCPDGSLGVGELIGLKKC